MKKYHVVLIAVSIAPMLLVSCASVSDEMVTIFVKQGRNLGDDIASRATKQGSNVTDEAAKTFSKNKTPVVPVTPKNVNLNKSLKKCAKQAVKSAVVEALQRQGSSDNQVSEDYLLVVTKDAIQKCTVGKVGDQVLDELANSVISEFKQKQLSRQ